MRDLYHNVGFAVAIPAAIYDADNTPAAVDILGFDSAVIELAIGTGGITFTGTNKVEFKLTHSNDNSTYDAVTAADVLGVDSVGTGGIIKSLIAAHATADITKIGYVGGRRYLKLLADFSGTHATGTPIAASVVKANAASKPVA